MHIVLASKSPRRQQLLAGLDIPYSIDPIDVPEDFPDTLSGAAVAEYLAASKSRSYLKPLENRVLLTADTIVCLNGETINKPADMQEARHMLLKLQGQMHEVFTGVCLRKQDQRVVFSECTRVHFGKMTEAEIDYYTERYKPLDKAGAYGVQEWFGYVAVLGIEGCFYNVMGLPLSRLYRELQAFNN